MEKYLCRPRKLHGSMRASTDAVSMVIMKIRDQNIFNTEMVFTNSTFRIKLYIIVKSNR